MQCEICGVEITSRPIKVVIDGSEMQVCSSCARFGKAVDKFSPVSRKVAPVLPPERTFTARRPPARSRRDEFRDMAELISDYGSMVRTARENMELTPEELGVKIKEKSSLVKKIERQDIIPEDAVRVKLEKALNIKLTDKVGDAEWKNKSGSKGTTLGDIAFIKKK